MRSSLVVRASDCQCTSCNGLGFDPSIRRHSGIWGAADEAVLNIVWKKSMIFPSPAGMSLTKFSPCLGEIKLFPARGSFISDIPSGDRKIVNLFYSELHVLIVLIWIRPTYNLSVFRTGEKLLPFQIEFQSMHNTNCDIGSFYEYRNPSSL
jgi:hypothetical protein